MTKDELQQLLGQNLRKYRIERNVTQEALAEEAGISTTYYAALENGRKSPSMLFLRQIADGLNVSIDYLLREEQASYHTKNIAMILEDQPVEIVSSIEKLARLCVNEFADNERTSNRDE